MSNAKWLKSVVLLW